MFDINEVNAHYMLPLKNTFEVLFQITKMQRCSYYKY